MFRQVSQWLTKKGDEFLRGGVRPAQSEESVYDMDQGFTDAYATADTARREAMDPFHYGNDKYGGRKVYRCRDDLAADAAERMRQEAEAQQEQMQQAAYQAQQYQQPQQQYAQEQMQQAAYQAQQYQQSQQQYAQEQMQQTGTYQAQQYQQPQQQYAQEQMQQTGTYQAQQYQQPQQQYAQEQMQQAAYQAQQPQGGYQQAAQASNVVTFPGMQTAPDGRVYAHVEYIIQMTNRMECRNIIEYIRSNASVFLNMEAIISDVERQRCVDMLSGAAYALGCSLNKISARGVYLISSASVRVMMDRATQRIAETPDARGFARQSYEQESAQSRPAEQPQASNRPVADDTPEDSRQTGFSSGSPTTRFQSQGAHAISASYATMAAGTYTGTHRAVSAH